MPTLQKLKGNCWKSGSILKSLISRVLYKGSMEGLTVTASSKVMPRRLKSKDLTSEKGSHISTRALLRMDVSIRVLDLGFPAWIIWQLPAHNLLWGQWLTRMLLEVGTLPYGIFRESEICWGEMRGLWQRGRIGGRIWMSCSEIHWLELHRAAM